MEPRLNRRERRKKQKKIKFFHALNTIVCQSSVIFTFQAFPHLYGSSTLHTQQRTDILIEEYLAFSIRKHWMIRYL